MTSHPNRSKVRTDRLPTRRYVGTQGDWFATAEKVERLACVHVEHCVGLSYHDPWFKLNEEGEQGLEIPTSGPWANHRGEGGTWSTGDKISNYTDTILACNEPVLLTRSDKDGHRAGYIGVFKIANARIDRDGLRFDFIERIAHCK
jgi:hypothetical protein